MLLGTEPHKQAFVQQYDTYCRCSLTSFGLRRYQKPAQGQSFHIQNMHSRGTQDHPPRRNHANIHVITASCLVQVFDLFFNAAPTRMNSGKLRGPAGQNFLIRTSPNTMRYYSNTCQSLSGVIVANWYDPLSPLRCQSCRYSHQMLVPVPLRSVP